MIRFAERINEKSTKCFFVVLRDQLTGDAVTPTSLKWTLVDENENVINDREQIVIASENLGTATDDYGNAATIITLSGNDFGVYESETGEYVTRHLVIEGTYDGACGDDLPVTEYIEFEVANIPYLRIPDVAPSDIETTLIVMAGYDDPNDPPEGHARIWLSDGTTTGNYGDLLYKITLDGVTYLYPFGNAVRILTKATSGTLSAYECIKTQINNIGQTDDCLLELPIAIPGLNLRIRLSTTVAKYFRVKPQDTDNIWLDGSPLTDGYYVGVASAYAGNTIYFEVAETATGVYNWDAVTGSGSWTAQA